MFCKSIKVANETAYRLLIAYHIRSIAEDNMKHYRLLPLLLVLVLVACNNSKTNTESPLSKADANATNANIPSTDEIVLIVARHMFERLAPKEPEDCKSVAYIIGEKYDTPELLAAFQDFRVPVLSFDRLKHKGGSPYDKQTDIRAWVWDKFDIKGTSSTDATVGVEYYSGPEGGEGFTVQLIIKDDKWTVESVVSNYIF